MKTTPLTPNALDRLCRAAAAAPCLPVPAMPFGFDTRVVALWHGSISADPVAITRLLRRVMMISCALILLAGAGAYRDLKDGDDADGPFGDQYSFADNAIGASIDR